MTDISKDAGIAVGQVLLEEASFSHQPDYLSLPPDTKPEVGDVNVGIQTGIRADGKTGLIRVRVATREEANMVYRVSLTVVGLFEVQAGKENMPLKDFLEAPALALIFPFVREALANLTGRGRFGPVWLNPFNAQAASAAMKVAATPQKETE